MRQKIYFSGKSAIITGGSKGIGRAVAREFVRMGGSVCIIARSKSGLADAEKEITHSCAGLRTVTSISCDTTDMKRLKPLLEDHIKKNGLPDYLMNFVGYSHPGYIRDLSLEDFRNNMDTNYYGQLVPILVLLPHFMKERKGHIVACSSVAGYLGIMGFAAYTPTKFAISGLMESLRNELKPYNIRCSVLFPPDTDTPGLKTENKIKPKEVMIMSESGGLLTPEKVAEKLVRGIIKKKFYILPGQARLLWTIMRYAPNLSHLIMDGELARAKKKSLAEKQ
ncbi:MAG: SDR family oxidoreductase [Spirochaetes bacterium]|nr:SDR family oxidoreductase [Spirochaetota bacterium]